MRNNPYKDLPPLERKPDGSLYRMNPAQRKQANALIRRECCNCENGNCIALDDGDAHACPQMISFSVCCRWFRWSVLPLAGDTGSRDLPGTGFETLCGLWRRVRPFLHPAAHKYP